MRMYHSGARWMRCSARRYSGHETGTDQRACRVRFGVIPLMIDFAAEFGAPEEIRTPDPQIRSLVQGRPDSGGGCGVAANRV